MERLTIEEIEKINRDFLTAYEAARALEISIKTFYRNKDKMEFPINRVGWKYIIPKETFLAYLRAERNDKYVRH